MNIIDIINKKSLGESLTKEELSYAFNSYLKKEIPDCQMSSLLMAIKIKGLNYQETLDLTDIFINSGDVLDLGLPNTVDKHSTGGIGDKTTLVVLPLAACCGVYIPKMSGRGLGYTGGTTDKLESIKGFKTNLEEKEFIKLVKKNGLAICSQTANLVPMDKVIYALRDITATTNSVPLIAISIMSKKIACGAKSILIDIKYGKGALIKDKKEAKELSNLMIKIGKYYKKNVKTIISDMNNPLGDTIGNSLEVIEAIEVLKNKRNNYFKKFCLEIAANLVSLGKDISYREAFNEVNEALISGKAYKKFETMIKAQGGDLKCIEVSPKKQYILSLKTGKLKGIDALEFGKLSLELGAGRKEKNAKINHTVGIVFNKKIGDKIKKGDLLCTLYIKNNNIQKDITKYFDIK
ncbi:MAG TPA: thymidine phosphorylase [Bacilli bacterium]|nr:thymidine phosphorylase [Bacilli bacterium]